MGRTADDYKKLLQNLMPRGKLWNRILDSNLTKVLLAEGDEFSRVEGRAEDLVILEKDTRTTTELITEHETDFGLPPTGESLAPTLDMRQGDLHAALLKVGQQDKPYYIDIASALGYTVTIQEFRPAWCGLVVAGEPCGDQQNLFFWQVDIDIDSLTESIDVNITRLISRIDAVAPAHTIVNYRFKGAEFSRCFNNAFDRIPHYDNDWIELDFNSEFNQAFANNTDYTGVNYVGAFNYAFAIDFDRQSGGDFFRDDFDLAFARPS